MRTLTAWAATIPRAPRPYPRPRGPLHDAKNSGANHTHNMSSRTLHQPCQSRMAYSLKVLLQTKPIKITDLHPTLIIISKPTLQFASAAGRSRSIDPWVWISLLFSFANAPTRLHHRQPNLYLRESGRIPASTAPTTLVHSGNARSVRRHVYAGPVRELWKPAVCRVDQIHLYELSPIRWALPPLILPPLHTTRRTSTATKRSEKQT